MPGNNDPSQSDTSTVINKAGIADASAAAAGDAVDASSISYAQSTDSTSVGATRKRYRYVVSDPSIRSGMVGLEPDSGGTAGWILATTDRAVLQALSDQNVLLAGIQDVLERIYGAVQAKDR